VLALLGALALAAPRCAAPPSATPALPVAATPTLVSTPLVQHTPAPTRPSDHAETISEEGRSVVYGYTHQQPDGNRLVAGRGAWPKVEPVDLRLTGEPVWVLAARLDVGSVWAAVLTDGRVQAFRAVGETVEEIAIEPARLPAHMPPLLQVADGVPSLVTGPSSAASQLSHPVVLEKAGRLAFIEDGGDLVVWEDGQVARLPVNALPDARLLLDEAGRLLLLTHATTRYGHGVLGDKVEAVGITLVETEPILRVALTIPLPEPQVVEGIAPIWADLDDDGQVELLLPSQNLAELGAIRRTTDGADVAWTVPVGGRVGTNLAAVALPNGGLAVGVGRTDGILRMMSPITSPATAEGCTCTTAQPRPAETPSVPTSPPGLAAGCTWRTALLHSAGTWSARAVECAWRSRHNALEPMCPVISLYLRL
jgi:hypothetical protein